MRALALILGTALAVPSYSWYSGPDDRKVCLSAREVSQDETCQLARLSGYIVKQVDKQIYVLQDELKDAEVCLAISDQLFEGIDVSPTTKVKITGFITGKSLRRKLPKLKWVQEKGGSGGTSNICKFTIKVTSIALA